jgi:hypothetical protein
VTSMLHTIFFVPFRENICPALLRKIEQIPYQWIARWSWWNVFIGFAQPLVYNTQSTQGDSNADDGRGVQGFTSEHASQGMARHSGARVRNISEGQHKIPQPSNYEKTRKVRRNCETAQCSHTSDSSVTQKQGIKMP